MLKRIFDFMFSLIGLIFLLPFFILIAILIKLDSKGSVFFKQKRIGKSYKPFYVYKFRTMVENADEFDIDFPKGETDPRITRFGKFLRRFSIDELPQLINVLKGEMSLVGPRPTLEYQVKKYSEYQAKRLNVKPGITGWAQVNGRNKLTWDQKIEKDIWYVKKQSFLLDLKIMFKTIFVIFNKDNLYYDKDEKF